MMRVDNLANFLLLGTRGEGRDATKHTKWRRNGRGDARAGGAGPGFSPPAAPGMAGPPRAGPGRGTACSTRLRRPPPAAAAAEAAGDVRAAAPRAPSRRRAGPSAASPRSRPPSRSTALLSCLWSAAARCTAARGDGWAGHCGRRLLAAAVSRLRNLDASRCAWLLG
jgi:hypothetical protein